MLSLTFVVATAFVAVDPNSVANAELKGYEFSANLIHDFGTDYFDSAWKKSFTAAECAYNNGSPNETACAATWAGIQPTAIMESATMTDDSGLHIVLKGEDDSSAALDAFNAANALENIDTDTATCDCQFQDSTTGMVQSYKGFGPGSLIETRFKVNVDQQNPPVENVKNATGTLEDVVASVWLQNYEAEISFGVRAGEITITAAGFGQGSTGTPQEKVITMEDGFEASVYNTFSLWWHPKENQIFLYVNKKEAGIISGDWAGGVATSEMMVMVDLQINALANLDNVALKTTLLVEYLNVYISKETAAPTAAPTPAPDAAWELPQGCPEWCVADVTKGKKTASEVCDMAKCKTCTFPDSEVTCSSDAATPPSPTPSPAGTCKGWCSTDFDKGTSTDTLCGFKACTGCVFSDNSSCSGRRARWVQPCEQMSAIECMAAILDGQCMLQSDAVGKTCVDHIDLDFGIRTGELIYDDEGLLTPFMV